MIACRDFIEFLMDYLSGELPEAQREVFEAHLAVCASCVAYMKTYQETVRLGKEVCSRPEGPVPEDVPEDMVKAVLAALKKPS